MRGILKAWRHLSSYLRLHKIFRKRGRERKRELFGEALEAAVQAEANGDRQSLCTAIRDQDTGPRFAGTAAQPGRRKSRVHDILYRPVCSRYLPGSRGHSYGWQL